MNTQALGALAVGVAGVMLWSWWALLIAGVLLVVVPEVVALLRVKREQASLRRQIGGVGGRPGGMVRS